MAVVRNLMVRAGADFSAMRKEMDQAKSNVTDFRKKVNKEMDKMSAGISGSMKRVGVALAAAFAAIAIKKVVGFGKEAAKAYNEIAIANAKLERVMRNTMRATDAQIKSIQKLALAQQEIGVIDAGVQIAGAQELATYLSNAESLKMLLPTLNDMLAQQYGTDATADNAVQIATMIGKVMDGQLGALSRYGYSWTDAQEKVLKYGNELERANMLVKVIGQSVGGMNQALARTPTGKLSQLKNTFGAIKEELGKGVMTVVTALLPLLEAIAQALLKAARYATILASALFGVKYEIDSTSVGIGDQVDNLDDLEDAYKDVGDAAKKASKGLAAFDEVNQLNWDDGSGGSGDGGLPPGWNNIQWPSINPIKEIDWDGIVEGIPKLQIEFDVPKPPDAGIGGVATAVTSTVDQMNAEVKAKMQDMWNTIGEQTVSGRQVVEGAFEGMAGTVGGVTVPGLATGIALNWQNMWNQLLTQTQMGVAELQASWSQLYNYTGVMVPSMTLNIQSLWANMWNQMMAQTTLGSTGIQSEATAMSDNLQSQSTETTQLVSTNWSTMLNEMLANLMSHRPVLSLEWEELKKTIESMKIPLATTEENWKTTLANMLADLKVFKPAFTADWAATGITLLSLIPQMDATRLAWSTALSDMHATATDKINGIIRKISDAISAWITLQNMLGYSVDLGRIKDSVTTSVKNAFSSVLDSVTPDTTSDKAGRNLPLLGYVLRGLDATGEFVEDSGIGSFLRGVLVPGASAGGAVSIGKGAATGASKVMDDIANWLSNLLKGSGVTVPALATGGIVYGPTLAMIGEAGAEAVVPLEDTSFVDTLASAIGTAVVNAQQVAQGGKSDQRGDIVIQIDGTSLARVMYPYQQQEQQRRGTTVIRTV